MIDDALYWGVVTIITAWLIFVVVTVVGMPLFEVTILVSVSGVFAAVGTTAISLALERGA